MSYRRYSEFEESKPLTQIPTPGFLHEKNLPNAGGTVQQGFPPSQQGIQTTNHQNVGMGSGTISNYNLMNIQNRQHKQQVLNSSPITCVYMYTTKCRGCKEVAGPGI